MNDSFPLQSSKFYKEKAFWMPMKNPLTTLDEIVWKQFEKVTQYAHKKLGWNKYDLATITDRAFAAVSVGASVYAGIEGAYYPVASSDQIIAMAVSLMWLGAGYLEHQNAKKNKKLEKSELSEIVRTGAILQPQFSSSRPVTLCIDLLVCGGGIYGLLGGLQPAHEIVGGPQEYSLLIGLSLIATGATFLFKTSSDYFRSQLMTPPKAKKSLWNAAHESVASLGKYFKPAPKPVEAPAAKYAAGNYGGICASQPRKTNAPCTI